MVALNPDGSPDLRRRPRRDPRDPEAPRGRQRRRRWWWLDVGFGSLGPIVVLAVVLIFILSLGFLGLRLFAQHERDEHVAQLPASEEASLFDAPPASNYGAPLSPAVRLQLARFGIPLHMGPRGIPLIQERVSGDVREVTPVEMSFPDGEVAVPDERNADVLFAPGRMGQGVRWWSPEFVRGVEPPRPVDRVRWQRLQEEQLRAALRDVMLVFRHVTAVDSSRWDDRWGAELVALTEAVNERYGAGSSDNWIFSSAFIACDEALEVIVNSGISAGCPSSVMVDALDRVYIALGQIMAHLGRIGHASTLRSDPATGGFYSDTAVLDYQRRSLETVYDLMGTVTDSLAEVRALAEMEGYHFHVWLP